MDNCAHRSRKPRKKQIKMLELSEKKSKESQAILMSWYWKWNPPWRIVYLWITFSFNWLFIIWRAGGGGGGVRLKLDVQGQGGERILDVDRRGGAGGGSWKLDNFHGYHMCIIPNLNKLVLLVKESSNLTNWENFGI